MACYDLYGHSCHGDCTKPYLDCPVLDLANPKFDLDVLIWLWLCLLTVLHVLGYTDPGPSGSCRISSLVPASLQSVPVPTMSL